MIRWKNGRPIVEVYDPALGRKRHVKPSEFGMDFRPLSGRPLERAAVLLEQAALDAVAEPIIGAPANETCDSLARRWADDFPGRTTRKRSEATKRTMRHCVRRFGAEFKGRPLDTVTREEAVRWAAMHPQYARVVRTMFNDAVDAGLAQRNPFEGLRLPQSSRADIEPLTAEEVDALAETAVFVHGEDFGGEVAAMIVWTAYTCMRPGEVYAARYSLLDGDTYDLRHQLDSVTGQERAPKHDSVGTIYVPERARDAVLGKPRRLGDDLMFRSSRGKQFRAQSWGRVWDPVRVAFAARLPRNHHLRARVALDPADRLDFHELRHFGASFMLNELRLEPWVIAKQLRHGDEGRLVSRLYGHGQRGVALDAIRGAYGENAVELRPVSGDDVGTQRAKGQR